MAEIKISCPNCGQHIQCDAGYRGMQINCPNCRHGFLVPAAKKTFNANNPAKKKSHKEIVAEITEANRAENIEPNENSNGFPSTAVQSNKRFPKVRWAGVAGLALLVIFACRNWDGVSHFFNSAKPSVETSTSANTTTPQPQVQQPTVATANANNSQLKIDPATGLPALDNSSASLNEYDRTNNEAIRKAGLDPATGLPLVPQDDTNTTINSHTMPAQNDNGVDTFGKLKALAESDDADAAYKLAACYDLGLNGVTKNYQEALKWYRKAANNGIAAAQANLGRMYDDGKGVPKNYQEAVRWYQMAANNGDAVGQNNLGTMYATGSGISLDNSEAAMWYRKSAEQGYAGGQLNLGCFYMYGTGVPRNYVEAYSWISLAAAQGFPQANDALDEVAKRMTQDQISKAQEKAASFVPTKQN